LVAFARLPRGHTYYKVFGSGLSRCSHVAMASDSCQSPPPLHAAVALHELHVRARLLLAVVWITPILGRRVGLQARRCLSNLGLAELLHVLRGASLQRDLYSGAQVSGETCIVALPPPPQQYRAASRLACMHVVSTLACLPVARLPSFLLLVHVRRLDQALRQAAPLAGKRS
jgi:hypothetical protein